MLRMIVLGILLTVVLGELRSQQPWKPSPHVAATDPLPAEKQLTKMRVPDGFIVQLVAAEPDVNKPINIAFDAAGRLWVTESVEYPFAAPPDRKPKDRVKILEDFGPDGRARKITVFADGLNIPIGVLPLPGPTRRTDATPLAKTEAIVFSIPNVYRLGDTDGDGKADRREVLLSKYGSNDTHGLTGEFMMGFDGWIYACHGFANQSTVKGKGTGPIHMSSGNTYRFKPDGSRLEHFAHGQVNPFGLAFDPLGNLYSCDCHSRPIYQLLKGAYYPSFGRPHDGLGYGPEMLAHDHGSTAIAGISYYADDRYPEAFRDNIVIGNVVTNRINRDRLERHGSTYKAIAMPDFVTCDDPWFRPVDIKLGPDGALYVADFYNRIIGHYEVPLDHPGRDRFRGRIWRIVYRGPKGDMPIPAMPDFTRMKVNQLAETLDSPNLTARLFATHLLVERGGDKGMEAARRLAAKGTARQRAHALWVLERTEALDEQVLLQAATDSEPLVRVHAMRILAEHKPWTDAMHLAALARLRDNDAFVQRAAAEALAAHPSSQNLKALLALLEATPAADDHLVHATRMALRDHLTPTVWKDVNKVNWTEKEHRALAEVCPGLRSRESAVFLMDYVKRENGEGLAALPRFAHHIARHGPAEFGNEVLALFRGRSPNDLLAQARLLKTVIEANQERGGKLSAQEQRHAGDLTKQLLRSADQGQMDLGVELAGSLRLVDVQDTIASLAGKRGVDVPRRKKALQTLASLVPGKHAIMLAKLLADDTENFEVREQAVITLAAAQSPSAQSKLIDALQAAPAPLQRVIALALSGSATGGAKLLEAVDKGKASGRLLQDREVDVRLRQARVPDIDKKLVELTRGLPAVDARLQQLFNQRRKSFLAASADAAAGAKVFAKHCAACHQIANQGAKIGPQLDGIGIRGLDRLLEDILDPNRNVDQAFRMTVLTLKNGQLANGLFLRQDGEVYVLADLTGKEVRVSRKEVEERATAPLSPMPANFVDQVSERDFHDLLAYLLAQRAAK